MAKTSDTTLRTALSIKFDNSVIYAALSIGALVALCARFGNRVFLDSGDAIIHYSMIHDISRFGHEAQLVLPGYPPAAHWAAVALGWIGGNDLIAMSLVSVVATFVCYFLITFLLGNRLVACLVFAVLFAALWQTRAMIGGEIKGQFFYPQLVGDVAMLSFTAWLATTESPLVLNVMAPIVGALAMWAQPLISVHILAAGCLFALFLLARDRTARALVTLAWLVISSGAIVALHPTSVVMRQIAKNDGAIDIRLSDQSIMILLIASAATGSVAMFHAWRRKSLPDAAIACPLIGALGLIVLQFLALKIAGEGSLYAVKKHLFLLTTFALINASRLIGDAFYRNPRILLAGPLIASMACVWVFKGNGVPPQPLLNALSYARLAATLSLPNLRPGNTAADLALYTDRDPGVTARANLLVSADAFDYPLSENAWHWIDQNRPPERDAAYVMVPRTAVSGRECKERFAESATFLVVNSDCMMQLQSKNGGPQF